MLSDMQTATRVSKKMDIVPHRSYYMPSRDDAYVPYDGLRHQLMGDVQDLSGDLPETQAKKFLTSDRRQGIKVNPETPFLQKNDALDWNGSIHDAQDKPAAWANVINKVVMLTNGLKSVTVTALINNVEKSEQNHGLEALSLAWQLLLGRRNPTGIVDITAMMGKLKDQNFQALVYGVRTGNEKCTVVKTYIYSKEPTVRMAIAELKDVFDEVLPIVFVDPTNCKDSCSPTLCQSQKAEELWMCHLKEEFKRFVKTFKAPAEDGQLAIFPYLLSLEAEDVSAQVGVYLVDMCDPAAVCGRVKPVPITVTSSGLVTTLRFLSSEAFGYFLCWLVSKDKTLTGANVNKWNICGYNGVDDQFTLDKPAINKPGDVNKTYVYKVHKTMTELKGLLDYLLKDNDSNAACFGMLLCKKQDLTKHIKCVIDKAKTIHEAENNSIDACTIAGLKAAMSTVSTHLVDFVNTLHEAVNNTAAFPLAVGKAMTHALCKMISHVVPWYYDTVQYLEVFWTASRLTHVRTEACVTRLVVPSPVLEKKQLALELARQAPDLFKDGQTEPRMSDLRDILTKRPDSAEAALATEYMKLDSFLTLQRRMAEYDLSMAEIQEAETSLCDVLAWAVSKKILSDSDRSTTLKWILGMFEEFRRTALVEDHKLVTKALKRRKEKDEQIKKMLRTAIKQSRESLELLHEVMLSVGYNPVTDQLLEKKASDALRIQGLAALVTTKAHHGSDERIINSLAHGVHFGATAAGATADALSAVAETFKKAPKGPYTRTSQFDAVAFPYSQSFLNGILDDGYYLPVRVSTLASNYVSIWQ